MAEAADHFDVGDHPIWGLPVQVDDPEDSPNRALLHTGIGNGFQQAPSSARHHLALSRPSMQHRSAWERNAGRRLGRSRFFGIRSVIWIVVPTGIALLALTSWYSGIQPTEGGYSVEYRHAV